MIRNNSYYIRHWYTLITMLLSVTLLVSCKKDRDASLPGDRESASVNLYITSDVMNAAYGPGRGTTAAYIDSITNHGSIIYNTDSRYPVFAFGFLANPEFPQVFDQSGINLFTYTRFNAGSHRLIFTDVTNTPIADTAQALEGNTWNSIYLADKPHLSGSEAAYTILSVNEPRKAQEGKTGVRFIHLSPDAGQLECKALMADGTIAQETLATVRFRDATDYTWLTQEQAANGLLRIQISNSKVNLITAVPARPGRAFVVVIRGFANNTIRRVTTGKNTDGSQIRENVKISANVRADVRASY